MILEVAHLTIVPGRESDFEAVFEQAARIIAAAPGHVSHQLQRCIEVPGRYVLFVNWQTLQDHTENFRKLPAHDEWKRLLQPFYHRPTQVEHYELLA